LNAVLSRLYPAKRMLNDLYNARDIPAFTKDAGLLLMYSKNDATKLCEVVKQVGSEDYEVFVDLRSEERKFIETKAGLMDYLIVEKPVEPFVWDLERNHAVLIDGQVVDYGHFITKVLNFSKVLVFNESTGLSATTYAKSEPFGYMCTWNLSSGLFAPKGGIMTEASRSLFHKIMEAYWDIDPITSYNNSAKELTGIAAIKKQSLVPGASLEKFRKLQQRGEFPKQSVEVTQLPLVPASGEICTPVSIPANLNAAKFKVTEENSHMVFSYVVENSQVLKDLLISIYIKNGSLHVIPLNANIKREDILPVVSREFLNVPTERLADMVYVLNAFGGISDSA
jgi:hypothetical protein